MDPTPTKHQPANVPPQDSRGGAAADEQLIAFTREYFAEDFPNPGRVGCPAPGELRRAARSGELPGEEMRAHLFGCSPCLRGYREAMSSRARAGAWPVATWLHKLGAAVTYRPVTAALGGFVVLLVLASPVAVWRARRSSQTEPHTAAAVENVGSTPAAPPLLPSHNVNVAAEGRPTVTPVDSARPARRRPRVRAADARAGRDLIAADTVRIDLEDYALLRETDETGEAAINVIRLAPSRHRLVLRLPETGAGGLYEVSVVDPFDKPLTTTKARSRDGKTLAATLNLRRLKGKKYRLRVARESEAPSYYPLLVEGEPPLTR